jgi:Zn-dependent metalloprotease
MGFIGAIISGIAGQVFKAGYQAYQRSSEESDRAQAAENALAKLPNAVSEARAQSEKARASGKGSFAQQFQAQIAKTTDADGDGKISKDELAKQVTAGGGSDKQAAALFKALDKNGDGTVTVDEMKDGIPVPNTAVAQQIMQMIQVHRDAVANGQDPKRAAQAAIQGGQVPGVNAAPVLARLAAQVSSPAPAKV